MPWPILYYFFAWIPVFIRDYVYSFIAVNRYRFFGKNGKICERPKKHELKKFLDFQCHENETFDDKTFPQTWNVS